MNPRRHLLYGGVALLLIAIAAFPLVSGRRTLYIRDVFGTHLEMKWVQAQAMRQGRLPEIDPYRAGGQPLLGNLNAAPLYPDNLLFLVSSFFWAYNAHFWIHWLLAVLTMAWLGRAWGLSKEGAWGAGAIYASSGFLLSNLNFYNLIAGAALTPALVAAALDVTAAEGRRWSMPVAAAIWGLMILAGDPMYAVSGLALAYAAVLTRKESRQWRALVRLTCGVAIGTLLVAPQVVEFLRILPHTYRGHWGFSLAGRLAASWNPMRVVDLFIPMFLGLPSLAYWGVHFTGGDPPLFFSLFPGAIAWLLVLLSGRARGRAMVWWSWGAIMLGVFLVLGGFNPLLWPVYARSSAGVLRFPAKFWLLITVGMAVLGGRGMERLLEEGSRRFRWLLLGAFCLFYLVLWGFLNLAAGPIEAWSYRVMAKPFNQILPHPERIRWAGLCLLLLVLLALVAFSLRILRRKPVVLVTIVVALQVGSQLFLLRPLFETDDVAYYKTPPNLLDVIPKDAVITAGNQGDLFGGQYVPFGTWPDLRLIWGARYDYQRLVPWAGIKYGRHYMLDASTEGLDSFLTRSVVQAVETLPDEGKIRLVAVSGAQFLALDRDLKKVSPERASLVTRRAELGNPVSIYRIRHPAPRVLFTGNVYPSQSMNQGLNGLLADDFDPTREVVLAGGEKELQGEVGRVKVMQWSPRAYRFEVEAPNPGVLVIQRALQPLYDAWLDGKPVQLVAANLDRMGVVIDQAGHHVVEIRLNRRPLAWSLLGTLLALVVGAAWWKRGW